PKGDLCPRLDLHSPAEDWGFGDGHPDVESYQYQHEARHERHAPAPGGELLVRKGSGQRKEEPVGQQEAGRRAHLGEARVETPLVLRRVLGRYQDGATPLAAEAEALQKSQDYQQDRRGDPYGGVSWQQAYQHRGYAHH